jgi:hypothetical protein
MKEKKPEKHYSQDSGEEHGKKKSSPGTDEMKSNKKAAGKAEPERNRQGQRGRHRSGTDE